MIIRTKSFTLRAVFCTVLALGMISSPVFGQSFLSSIESVIGPVNPAGGIASSFRSETGTGLSIMSLKKAHLSGGGLPATVSLERWANLDESPVRFDVYGNLRFWRLGARVQWTQFEARSLSPDLGKYSFNTIKLGADFDAVQHRWLAVGASLDFYLANPEFHGNIRQPNILSNRQNIDFVGKKPATIGAHARYIPPEILNIPVHLELYANFPLYGSSLTQYGGALVFRPQIYRFDLAIKGVLEYDHLKVLGAEDVANSANPSVLYPSFTIDTEWFRYGVDVAVYF